MSTNMMRVLGTGLSFFFIFGSGIWLSLSGRPLNGGIFAIHKIVSLGVGIFLIITMYKLNQAAPLGMTTWIAIVVTGLCFLGLVVSGSLLSFDKSMTVTILRVHQILPILTLVSTAICLYLLLSHSQ